MAEQKSLARKIADNQIKGAPRALLEDLFEDYYAHRRQLYFMNLIRGIFFGFGSVLGGTIVVALVLWVLAIFHYVPFLNDITDAAQHTLQTTHK